MLFYGRNLGNSCGDIPIRCILGVPIGAIGTAAFQPVESTQLQQIALGQICHVRYSIFSMARRKAFYLVAFFLKGEIFHRVSGTLLGSDNGVFFLKSM